MSTAKFRSLRAVLAVLAGVVLVAGACSSDDGDSSAKGDESSEQSSDSDNATGDTSPDADTESSQPEAPFTETVTKATEDVKKAADACDLFTATQSLVTVGNPETPEETRTAVEFYMALVNKMADTSSDPATAEALRTGAENFEAYAESVDYDPTKMDLNGSGPEFEGSEAMDEALNTYSNTEFKDCNIPGMPSVPEGGASTAPEAGGGAADPGSEG